MENENANTAPRTASIERATRETVVRIQLNLDGEGSFENDTGLGFLDHMLDLFARHGGFDLESDCEGDLEVDDHHTAEDVGISLGMAFQQALGDKAGIERYGHAYVPMDETLARAVVDLSGRTAFHYEAEFTSGGVGDLSTEMIEHFWKSFADQARCNLHISVLYGRNDHHRAEAIFKAVARALGAAVRRDPARKGVLSTKGSL